MKRFGVALLMLTCACAGPSYETPALNLFETKAPHEVESHFKKEIEHRYRRPAQAGAVKDDLLGQGFNCQDVPPVEARGDYLVATCKLAKPFGFCTNQWQVDLRHSPKQSAPDAVIPHGRFTQACTYPRGG